MINELPADSLAICDVKSAYATWETVFEPGLRGRPVIVAGNNHGCVIALNSEAKTCGIVRGAPLFQIEHLIRRHKIEVFDANFELYHDLSERFTETIQMFTPEFERNGIDETFFALQQSAKPFDYICREIREALYKFLQIETCIGNAETKTLAKLANQIAKNSEKARGVVDIYKSQKYREAALRRTKIIDVWEIGKKTVEKLAPEGIETAYDFTQMDLRKAKSLLTIKGGRTLLELRGVRCYPLVMEEQLKKSVTRGRSFSEPVTEFKVLHQAVSSFLARAAELIRESNLAARSISISIWTNRFKPETFFYNADRKILSYPTNNLFELQQHAFEILDRIYQKGRQYRKAEVTLGKLIPADGISHRLYREDPLLEKQENLMRVMDAINQKHGKGTIRTAVARLGKWQGKVLRRSPRYTTRIGEIIQVF